MYHLPLGWMDGSILNWIQRIDENVLRGSGMIVNFAERAHNHNWSLDPITRSLLDNDFYKFLMLQFIWKHFPKVDTVFSLVNRSSAVRLAEIVGVEELVRQLI